MTSLELYRAYARERRAQEYPGFALEVFAHLSRYTAMHPNAEGMVLFADLSPNRSAPQIDEQIAYFEQRRQNFEWKVYELESPATLKEQLEARGFVSDPAEAFLVFPLAGWAASPPPLVEGAEIESVHDAQGIEDVIAVQSAVWGRDSSWLRERLNRGLQEGGKSIYCAHLRGRPVGTGWLDFIPGTQFADLHGGSILPEFRGRGLFSALLHYRQKEAQQRGIPYLTVDAAPMSRPILLRKGFHPVCMTYPMRRNFVRPDYAADARTPGNP